MISALGTIIPIFLVIALGYGAKKKGLLSGPFMAAGNRLLYMVAIPCLLFHKISTAPFQGSFFPHLILGCVAAIILMSLGVFFLGRFLALPPGTYATFVQSSIHGNIGYIGLAVCYYSFDEKTFGVASVLAGFFIITQNILSVLCFHLVADRDVTCRGGAISKLLVNPIILSTLAGLVVSFFNFTFPLVIDKALMMVGKMALPMALLIIGGSLNTGLMFRNLRLTGASSLFKMVFLPLAGTGLFYLLSVPGALWLPGVILLSTPSATTCYVMAGELHGDTDLASSAVTTSTLLSLFTFVAWLSIFM
jgi:predicted permease